MSNAKRLSLVALGALASAAALLALSDDAHACGGLFCNGPPPNPFAPLPVAQNGENVVFAITKDPAGGAPTMEAHIQILYTGDAAKFSWVVPVDAEPTLSTGTDRLFSALAQATTPNYQGVWAESGTCIPEPPPPPSAGNPTGSFGTGVGTGSAGTTGSAGGVQVSFQGAVGPFDAAVIKSDDPMALKMWLSDNGYVVTDAASGLIDDYVHENKYFVALKLLNGVGVSAIQPIVLTFRGTEACVPLRLTAIAANPDMPVLVWVLGSTRVAPRGFYEMKIDEARINWVSGGGNYFGPKGLVSLAADEVGGNAFVTEYAGRSTVAQASVYANGVISLDALRAAMTPPLYVQLIASMGLANDPVMLGLLQKFIPMPDAVKAMNIMPAQFYGNLSLYWNQYAFPPFDLAGLSDAIETSIVNPRIAAQMMIDAHPYLTRLNTFISPAEMTQDPFFFESQDLPDLSNLHSATLRRMCGNREYMACNAPLRLELADGRMAWLRAGVKASYCQPAAIDDTGLAGLPAAEGAWEREVLGEGNHVVDNTAKITAGLMANNRKFMVEEKRYPTPVTGAAGSGPSGAAGSSGGAGLQNGSGCSCDLVPGMSGTQSLLALAGALGLLVWRRRGRASRR